MNNNKLNKVEQFDDENNIYVQNQNTNNVKDDKIYLDMVKSKAFIDLVIDEETYKKLEDDYNNSEKLKVSETKTIPNVGSFVMEYVYEGTNIENISNDNSKRSPKKNVIDSNENPHKGHRIRAKKKFIKAGSDAFADHELLEMLLYYAYPLRDTNEIAHEMIRKFGTFHNLLDASVQEIVQKCNVTENVAVLISLIMSFSKRYNSSKWDNRADMTDPSIVGEYCSTLFMGENVECFYIICLDNRCRHLYTAPVSRGTLSESQIYPRHIVELAINHKAAYVILSHNHPGASLFPSKSDIDSTKVIIAALKLVQVAVLDHIIIGGKGYYSFAEKRLLNMHYLDNSGENI